MKVFIRRITERDLGNLQAWSDAIGSHEYMEKVSPQSFNGSDLSGWGDEYVWFIITADGRDVGGVWVERRRWNSVEGTLGIITRGGLKVAPLPKERRLVLASFESAEAAGQAVIAVFSQGITPSACEILDRTTLKVLRLVDPALVLPDDGDVILLEVEGSRDSTAEAAEQIEKVCRPMAITIRQASGREMEPIWMARRLVGAAISRLDPKKTRIYMGEDVGVPIKQIPTLIKRVQQITAGLGIPAMKYGHIGDGNLHVALFIDVNDPDQWDRLRTAADRIHRAALSLGGTVSSEHGIGLARAEYMAEQVGEESLNVMRAIKKSLDPRGILNPGKMGL